MSISTVLKMITLLKTTCLSLGYDFELMARSGEFEQKHSNEAISM